jgi:hypothetical protein
MAECTARPLLRKTKQLVSQNSGKALSLRTFLGSVVQWIVFQIPILKMQVRFLPGLQLGYFFVVTHY